MKKINKVNFPNFQRSVRFKKLNANNASAKELFTRIGNLRLRIAFIRGDSSFKLNDYSYLYDNVARLDSNTKNGIVLNNDTDAWMAYHKMTRKHYLYKNLKIWGKINKVNFPHFCEVTAIQLLNAIP